MLKFFNSKGFTRIVEDVDPEIIQDNEFQQMDEMVLDSVEGVPTQRNGFASYGSSIPATLYSLNEVSINNQDYFVCQAGGKFKKSTGGTGAWSDIKTSLNSSLPIRIAQSVDTIICTNGSDGIFTTDLTTFNNFDGYYFYLQIPTPVAPNISFNISPSGGFLDGQSYYSYCFVYATEDGSVGQPSDIFTPVSNLGVGGSSPILLTTGMSGNNYSITINNLPYISNNYPITNIYIYRTAKNKSQTFYFLDSIPLNTSTYIDIHNDTDLDISNTLTFVNTPLTSKYVLNHKGRIFFGNISKQQTVPQKQIQRIYPGAFSGSNDTGLTPNQYYTYAITFILADGTETPLYEDNQFQCPEIPTYTYTLSYIYCILSPLLNTTNNTALQSDINQLFSKMRIWRRIGTNPYYLVFEFDNSLSTVDGTHIGWAFQQFMTGPNYGIQDVLSDAILVTKQQYTPPPSPSTISLPSSVVWSEVDKIREYPELNIQDVESIDGNPITGMVDDVDGILIFKQDSAYKLYTTGTQPGGLYKVIPNIGCDQPNSIIQIAGQVFFVCKNQIYTYSRGIGVEPVPISKSILNTCNSITVWNDVCFSETNQWIIWSVVLNDSTNRLIILDLKSKQFIRWYRWKVKYGAHILERRIGNDKGSLIIAGTRSGTTYLGKYSSSQYNDDFSGESNYSPTVITTKKFTNDGIALIRLRKLWIDGDTNGFSPKYTINGIASISDIQNNIGAKLIITDSVSILLRVPSQFVYLTFSDMKNLRGFRIAYEEISRGTRE